MSENNMRYIGASVKYVGELLKMFAFNKKRIAFEDPSLMQDIFKELKDGQNYQEQLFQRRMEAEKEISKIKSHR